VVTVHTGISSIPIQPAVRKHVFLARPLWCGPFCCGPFWHCPFCCWSILEWTFLAL